MTLWTQGSRCQVVGSPMDLTLGPCGQMLPAAEQKGSAVLGPVLGPCPSLAGPRGPDAPSASLLPKHHAVNEHVILDAPCWSPSSTQNNQDREPRVNNDSEMKSSLSFYPGRQKVVVKICPTQRRRTDRALSPAAREARDPEGMLWQNCVAGSEVQTGNRQYKNSSHEQSC